MSIHPVHILQNDPSLVHVEASLFESDLNDVGEALQRNVHVSSLCLNVQGFSEFAEPPMESLLRYLSESGTLRTLELQLYTVHLGDFLNRVVKRILDAAAENTTIEALKLQGVHRISRDDIYAFLGKKAKSLKGFSANLILFREDTTLQSPSRCMTALAKAIAAVESLESLELGRYEIPQFQCILHELHAHPRLCNLTMDVGNGADLDVTAVSNLLASNPLIETLEWKGLYFTEETMKLLIHGLDTTQGLQKLRFDCRVDLKAARVFQSFLLGTNYGQRTSPLQELAFGSSTFGGLNVKVLLRMLSGLGHKNENGRAVTSSIQRVDLDFCRCFEDVFRDVLKFSKLAHLHIGHLVGSSFRSLPQWPHLRELKIDSIWYWDRRSFFPALYRNGSLHHVSIARCNDEGPFLSESDLKWIHAIGERNRLVPQLVQTPHLDHVGGDDETTEANSATTALAMFPPLFQVIMPAEQTTSNTVLSGLLALSGDLIRQGQTGSKRSSS